MNSLKETAADGLNALGCAGLITTGAGVLGATGGAIINNLGGEIQANFFNGTADLVGIGLVTTLAAWGLKKVFLGESNTEKHNTPKIA